MQTTKTLETMEKKKQKKKGFFSFEFNQTKMEKSTREEGGKKYEINQKRNGKENAL